MDRLPRDMYQGAMQCLRELAPGGLVATSSFALIKTVVVAAGDGGCLVIDPGITVAGLAGLSADLTEAGLQIRAGFATHRTGITSCGAVTWAMHLGTP